MLSESEKIGSSRSSIARSACSRGLLVLLGLLDPLMCFCVQIPEVIIGLPLIALRSPLFLPSR